VIERSLLLLSGSCSVWCLASTPARIHILVVSRATSSCHSIKKKKKKKLPPATLFIFRNFLPRLFIYFFKNLYLSSINSFYAKTVQ
jgi:hypothetical protein